MTAPLDATCPRHPDAPAVGSCRRCGTFVCAADTALLDGALYCVDCAARDDVDYLEAYRKKVWGKRDGWAYFFGVGALFNLFLVGSLAVLLVTDRAGIGAAENPLLILSLLGWGVMSALYFFGVRAARPGLFVMVLLYGAAQVSMIGPAAVVSVIFPLLFVASAFNSVRSRLFFKLSVPRTRLKKEWDRLHNNVLARNAVTLGVAGLAIAPFAPFAVLAGAIAWRRVNPEAIPPIGRKKTAIAGVVLGLLGTLFWGAVGISIAMRG